MGSPVLNISNLNVAHNSGAPILRDLSLSVGQGEIVALVGESGSGKSVTAKAATRLLPESLRVETGQIHLNDQDILSMSEKDMNNIRGGSIGMLFQQPKSMLDPTMRVGAQIAEPLRQHRGMSRRQAQQEAIALIDSVGIPHPERRARAYAHELSGGMAQRVMIAIALAGNPKLLIADEPTTALDTLVQRQILRLLVEKKRTHDLSILLITHDFAVVSAVADRVAVMYGGEIVETGATSEVMNSPRHPYTKGLIQCSLMLTDEDGRLTTFKGADVIQMAEPVR